MSARLMPSFGRPIRVVLLVVFLAVLAVGAVKGPAWLWDKAGDWVAPLNPFEEETVDRTGPSVLRSLTERGEFRAASAYYETVVDIERDTQNLPDWFSGERVLYVGKGNVDAYVDFGELDERRVVLSEDGTSVTIRLPSPTLDEPDLDLETSYVYDRDEGVLTRFRGSDLEREAQLKAVEQMAAAATGEGRLTDLAEESTTAMLNGMFGALGYTDITITFDA